MLRTLHQHGLLRSQAWINGQWQNAASGKTFDVTNPANGECLTEVADLGQEDILQAIEAAETALPAWRALCAKERSTVLLRWYELIMSHQEELATLMTLEQGKPLAESKGEVAYGASFIQWFAEEAKRVYGDVIPQHGADKRLMTIKQPVGVVAAITPWNFPIAMITRKAGPALAAGCTIVIKPAALTPLCALALAELSHQAGIPAGVLNVLPTKNSAMAGQLFSQSEVIRKLSFTGSTEVGRKLMAQCAGQVKRVSMELGGNAPFIVFDDADLEEAVNGAIISKFRNAGQTCVCANRLLVQSGIHDRFVARLKERVAEFKVGSGMTPGVTIGPLINQSALSKVEELVADAAERGAQLELGGNSDSSGASSYYLPTIMTGVTPQMAMFNEEIFGPVAPVVKFDDEDEAIAMANDTPYGLAAYFYARDIGRIWRVSEALEYGMVGINEGLVSTEVAPFGGVKQSGVGREGSKYGMDEYLEIKYLCMGGIR